MTKLSAWKKACIVFALCVATTIFAQAQVFRTLVSFNLTDGAEPINESLVQGIDGSIYGTTELGGNLSTGCNGGITCGTVFKVARSGGLTVLHAFCAQLNNQGFCADGRFPTAGLVLATDRNFYGTTSTGGTNNNGTVFEMTSEGELTTLHSFNYVDGDYPEGGLTQATDGNFYGTTLIGGAYRRGTIFRITPRGQLTTLYSFCAQPNCSDGWQPYANLVQATDGNLYGVTQIGGITVSGLCPYGCGTIFKITLEGTLTTLYSFCYQAGCADGYFPSGLVEATDGNFWGGTGGGGISNDGTVFKITSLGQLTTRFSFDGTDGAGSENLVQAPNGIFYGATGGGGVNNDGSIFGITADDAVTNPLTTLYSFCGQTNCADGSIPTGGLFQATNGKFYGTTEEGGDITCGLTSGCGTVFSLDAGLGPFVSFVRNPAKVGQAFGILGQGFTGTTNVSLNGIPTSFTVVSDTFIKATVPAGATTGYVTVTTPTGTLTSNVPFQVIP